MKITIEVIPHKNQRYSTVGDWQWNKEQNELTVRVSDMGDSHSNFLVGLHEVIEAYLCACHSISEKDVDNFDIEHSYLAEPGDSNFAPYHKEHIIAEIVERLVASLARDGIFNNASARDKSFDVVGYDSPNIEESLLIPNPVSKGFASVISRCGLEPTCGVRC